MKQRYDATLLLSAQMTIHFGNDFDSVLPLVSNREEAGVLTVGPSKLLYWLEAQLGLGGYPHNPDYLRIELYRQSLSKEENCFFSASFEADRFATAEFLLSWRDELLLAGWDFTCDAHTPPRLQALARVEADFRKKMEDPEIFPLATGFADRYNQVIHLLKSSAVPLNTLVLFDPLEYQEPHILRLTSVLRNSPVPVEIIEKKTGPELLAPNVQPLILRCRRDSDAAVFLAQLILENDSFRPGILATQSSLALEQSLLSEGFAALGMQSASLARPSLQILKLAPAFLWEPVDVFKIMEFLTLPLKPFDPGLALEIARVMAEKPGFFSDTWFAAVFGYLEKPELPSEARDQYHFWFDRRRYPADKTAPKRDAVVLYAYLHEWALLYFEESGSTNNSLLVLAEQARRIRDLLETLPEQRIGLLEMERIVRTVFEASPIQLAAAESGALDFFQKPGAVYKPQKQLVWWNFVAQNESLPVDKWKQEERDWLGTRHVHLTSAGLRNRLQQTLNMRPFQQVSEQIVFVIPEQVDGAEVQPHLMLSDLEVWLGEKFRSCVFDLEKEADRESLSRLMQLPVQARIAVRHQSRPKPVLYMKNPSKMLEAEYETPTNLESLLYYPHRWFFRQKLRLFPLSLLSISKETTLLGSLAHRFFERLLSVDILTLEKSDLQQWVDEEAAQLLPREGATLLLYGREPDRNAFLRKVKTAAWSLVSMLKSNHWTVEATELNLEGTIGGMPIRGKADLVISRGAERAIIDLKWSGAKRRKELILNGEDLQLILYANMLPPETEWPHTAYFILEEGKLIARNSSAFREAVVAGRGEPHENVCESILEKMTRTYAWRMQQIQSGHIEIRTSRTAQELEAIYEGQLFDLLEMKNEDLRWDDYKTLLE